MDVPLAINDIGIRNGLQGYIRKSSTVSQKADVVGFFASYRFYLREIWLL
jgi:hypothetical protein